VFRDGPPLNREPPDLLLTDAPLSAEMVERYGRSVQEGQVGLVGLGSVDGVDVSLPLDVGDCELTVTVQLLAQIVRLRRQQSSEREEHQQWVQLALRDPLTGLPNQRAWQQRLSQALAGHDTLAVALADLDHFKQVNDHHGHDVGDVVLREVAASFRAHVRGEDFVARLGGDEFGVLLVAVSHVEVEPIIRRLRGAAVEHLRRQSLPAPSLSVGYICSRDEGSRDPRHVLHAISQSLLEAKRCGRDCAVEYSPEPAD
jgi:diguanylate cyclase (GGDEF)-like protein